MKAPSLHAKKAHCARTRQSNYSASLRLAGIDVTPDDAERKLPAREAILEAYRQQAKG
ncbi:YhfG family protein [Pseudomonas sp. LF19]|uniref:YhfG family protein n=1 Tax=Pseudomonas sp. LF19 TaxID=2899115 RepID=UPI001F1B066D|nr:YhfG family protein [Pseudomonas sp. LF19]MCE5981754.1 YhfG family protein [Pseudomonas sp. LF19]